MEPLPVSLKELDRVEVLTLMDNFVDVLLEDTEIVTRPPKAVGGEIPTDTLLAEHGLCLLVKVQRGAQRHTLLFDTGYNNIGVLHNMAKLAVDPNAIEAIVLSHAHMDHTGSLHPILEKISNPIPLVVHPDAFLYPRFVEEKDGIKSPITSGDRTDALYRPQGHGAVFPGVSIIICAQQRGLYNHPELKKQCKLSGSIRKKWPCPSN